MSKVYDIETYRFSGDERLVVDTNVWLYVYGPVSTLSTKSESYSDFLDRARCANCELFLYDYVLVEFIKVYESQEKQNLRSELQKRLRKDLRSEEDWKDICRNIENDVHRVRQVSTPLGESSLSTNLDKHLSEYGTGNYDLVDLLIADQCKSIGGILITNDHDFYNLGVDLITGNTKLLQFFASS